MGFPRHDFLYEIQFWEVRRLIRGYRQRDKLQHQLLAECAYAAMYANRDPKGKTVSDLFPMLFQDDEENIEPPITEDERQEMLDLMARINEENKEAAEK